MALIVGGSCPFVLARPIFLEDDGEYLVDYEVALGVRRAVATALPKRSSSLHIMSAAAYNLTYKIYFT